MRAACHRTKAIQNWHDAQTAYDAVRQKTSRRQAAKQWKIVSEGLHIDVRLKFVRDYAKRGGGNSGKVRAVGIATCRPNDEGRECEKARVILRVDELQK